jgi:hypothetical protein
MSGTDDRRDTRLPVTNEIGSEGGSYADPTMQVETFEAPEARERTPGIGGPASAANDAIRREDIVERPSRPAGPESGVARYPTDPPPGEAPGQHELQPRTWHPGLVGAAAGLAIGLIAARRR